MNKQLLVIILSVFSYKLIAMESPLPVLLESHQENAKIQMLKYVDSIERSDELFYVSKQMLYQHSKFLANLQEAQQMWPQLEALTTMNLPTAIAWQQETISLSEQLHTFLSIKRAMQNMFDETLDNADSSSNHMGAVALRRSLTKALTEKNTNYDLLKKNLQKQFENQTLTRCTRPASINSINTKVIQLIDPEEKLLVLIKLAHFFTHFGSANTEFVKISQLIQKTLRIPSEENKSIDTYKQVINYCTKESYKLQAIILKEDANICKAIKDSARLVKSKALKKNLESIKAINLASIEERKALIAQLEKFLQFLSPHFLSSLEDNLRNHKEILTMLDAKAKDTKCEKRILANQSPIINSSSIPVSKHTVIPCNLAQMKDIKTVYPHFIPFRLKQPLCHTNEQDSTTLLYFCSKGSYLNQKEALEQLHPTTYFLFSTGDETRIIEEDTNTKIVNETLWYHPNGQYYFINHTLADPQAYQVDFVGALCFSKQQSPPSKI